MPNFKYKTLLLPAIALFVLLSFSIMLSDNLTAFSDYVKFELNDKTSFTLSLSLVDTHITALSSDPENELVLKIEIHDKEGLPVPSAKFSLKSAINKNAFLHPTGYTDKDGICLVTYKPAMLPSSIYKNGKIRETVTATISGTNKPVETSFDLTHIPVVFIHGYQASPALFDDFKEFLESKNFSTACLTYDSGKGVAYGAMQLDTYLQRIKESYSKKGLQIKRLDLIGHSMGGLVARYYTCSLAYNEKNNVEKIIFISVPQNGSSLASLGLKYYNDKGIKDLIPDSSLFVKEFPDMKNEGLNDLIQVGSIIGQYDEVVSTESASLDEWGIKTEFFNVGENNFTINKLLSGKIVEASNHKSVLYNKKVFDRVEEMLENELPYPIKK